MFKKICQPPCPGMLKIWECKCRLSGAFLRFWGVKVGRLIFTLGNQGLNGVFEVRISTELVGVLEVSISLPVSALSFCGTYGGENH